MAAQGPVYEAGNALIALKMLVERTAALTGKEFFRELVKSLAQTLRVHGVWIAVPDAEMEYLDAVAFFLNGKFVETYRYRIAGTPCELVFKSPSVFHVPSRVVELFPDDPDLRPLHAVSYMGLSLKNKRGQLLGHLAVMDNKPMPELPDFFALLNIFASRAAAELERLHIEATVKAREHRLSQLVAHAFDAIIDMDDQLGVLNMNPAAEKLLNMPGSSAQNTGKTRLKTDQVISLNAFLEPAGIKKIMQAIRFLKHAATGETSQWIPGHLPFRTVSGDTFHADATLTMIEEAGQTQFVLFMRNVQDKLDAELTIKQLSHDRDVWKNEATGNTKGTRIVGNSAVMQEALQMATVVAVSDASVLLEGETGTGKELFAQMIHQHSDRSQKPMVTVNCAALPPELMESELFGHVKGAFTGAVANRDGKFQLANGSSLFLDEVGELPLNLQAKILRALQEGEIQPIGGKNNVRVNVRIIAATHKNLKEEVSCGRFREDLYYRLHVLPVYIPPLRQRGHDIIELAEFYLTMFSNKYGKTLLPLSDAEKYSLLHYPWPGNVRELRNVIERAVLTSHSSQAGLTRLLTDNISDPVPISDTGNKLLTVEDLRNIETENIRKALQITGGRVAGKSGAASLLRMPPSTLASRIKALGISSKLPASR